VSDSTLNGANGGYAISTNTIYLNESLFSPTQGDLGAIATLVEEIGHWFDAQINDVDPVWDEGEVFAELTLTPPTPLSQRARGESSSLSLWERAGVRANRPEDDTATIYIDGVAIQIEQSIDVIGQWGGAFNGVQVVGNYAYIAKSYGLLILDISDPTKPIQLSNFYLASGSAMDVEVVGDQAFVADEYGGLVIIDVSNPAAPSRLGSFDTSGYAWDVEVVGDQAFVADDYGGLVIIDVSNPAAPSRLGSFDTTGYALEVQVVGDQAFVADYYGGLVIIDVSNPAAPSRLGSIDTTGYAMDVEVVGDQAFVADYDGGGGLVIIDVSNPAAPSRLGSFDTTGYALDVEVVGDQAFVADGDGGLVIIDVSDYITPVVPTLQFSQATYTVKEDGTLVGAAITVTRTGDLSNSSSVEMSITGGTATGGVDYNNSGFPKTINFAANQGKKTIQLPIIQDNLIEGIETVKFKLVNPNNATLGSQTTAQLRIRDDDNFDITREFTVAGGDASSPDPDQNISDPNFRNVNFAIVSAWDDQLKKAYTPGKNVWIVSHGWNGDFNNLKDNLGKTISQAKPDDIVLALDWTKASHTKDGVLGNFVAASWIRPLAEQIKETLKNWGLTDGSKLNLVGHSLGTLVSSELASLYMDKNGEPTVNSITALDPPSESNKGVKQGYDLDFRGYGYDDIDDRPKPFRDVAKFSRAFVGDPSIAGNEQFASWADESFLVNFDNFADGGGSHGWVVEVFKNLIDPSKTDFKLANDLLTLDDDKKHDNFKQNAFKNKHEGLISLDEPEGEQPEGGWKADDFQTVNYLLSVNNNSLVIWGTNKDDNIKGNQLKDGSVNYTKEEGLKLFGGNGNDQLTGILYNDILNGGNGIDVMSGGDGDDIYFVDNMADKITEGIKKDESNVIQQKGIDLVKSSSPFYTLPNNVENLTLIGTDNLSAIGNNLANQLTGNSGNNELSGLNNNDLLFGDRGNDTLLGGAGADTVSGGNGNDILLGGAGADTLTGGDGKDFFVYNLPTEGKDIITDFTRDQGDKIHISRSGFGLENLAAGALQTDYFVLGTGAKDEGDRFIFNSENNTLFFDSDGKGLLSERQKAIALISNNLDLKASDIILV
jgi:pimeloyl-ACP methyl ester carboxylesterase